jgi:hypothetical protein
MKEHARLRQHAPRLLTLSEKTREQGRHQLATELSSPAADAYEYAFVMDSPVRNRRMTYCVLRCLYDVNGTCLPWRLQSAMSEPGPGTDLASKWRQRAFTPK